METNKLHANNNFINIQSDFVDFQLRTTQKKLNIIDFLRILKHFIGNFYFQSEYQMKA